MIESQERSHVELRIALQQFVPLLQRANQKYDKQYEKLKIENEAGLEGLSESMSNEYVPLAQPMCAVTIDELGYDDTTIEYEQYKGENHGTRNLGKPQ